jgi:hypothetical protein
MKRFTGYQPAKQRTNVIVGLFIFYNKHEVRNKQGFLDLSHLYSEQQKHSKSQTHVQCYLFGKQQILICFSTIKAQRTSEEEKGNITSVY